MRTVKNILAFCLCIISSQLFSENLTIEGKIVELQQAPLKTDISNGKISPSVILKRLTSTREELKEKYQFSQLLIADNALEDEYHDLLEEINLLRNELSSLEKAWRSHQSEEIMNDSESYGIWEHDETTVSEIVMEYGSSDYLYIIPPDIAQQKLHVHSALMIPRESWSQLLETIFKHNGVGVREINPYTRQLFTLKQDNISFASILTSKDQLKLFDRRERISYIYSPAVDHLKQAYYFIERFRDPKTTFVYQVGSKVAIVGFQEDVSRLLTLCDNVWESGDEKTVKVVSTAKISADEAVKLLKSYFGTLCESNRSMLTLKGGHDLSATPLPKEGGVVLIGARSLVDKAEELILDIESQVSDPTEMMVYWHTCSHSNANDLSEILEKVYSTLIHSRMDISPEVAPQLARDPAYGALLDDDDDDDDDDEDFGNAPYAHQIESMRSWNAKKKRAKAEQALEDRIDEKTRSLNFIPYPAAGKIMMIIPQNMLGKIKEVIKRLDVPQRMVEIEVLLVERRLKNSSRSGINILRLGSTADNVNKLGIDYHGDGVRASQGLFEFIYSGAKNAHFPAIDLSYNFLLSQEDIRVTAAPSVITTNQSPALISVTDQISINNGASPVETNKGFVFKDSYERADFGITIKLTPTIHEPEIGDSDEQVYVTLENDISFETIKKLDGHHTHKPDVHKRQVKNQVRIADGQTVILGGLKNKSQEDKNEKIPFLGEIPGFGKLFGTNILTDTSGEMFIFIKPTVIHDARNDLILLREQFLAGRQGDSQIFLDKIAESRKCAKEKAFKRSLNLLWGERKDGTTCL